MLSHEEIKMDHDSVKKEIDQRKKEIKSLFLQGTADQDKTIIALRQEIEEIRENCMHEYENGKCIWCGKVED